MSARPYSTSTSGRNYILHIERANSFHVFCGRVAAEVNCAGSDLASHNQAELCKTCVKRQTRDASRKAGDR